MECGQRRWATYFVRVIKVATPRTIAGWALETFEYNKCPKMMAAILNHDVSGLYIETIKGNVRTVAERASNAYITLCYMAKNIQMDYPHLNVFDAVFSEFHLEKKPIRLLESMYQLVSQSHLTKNVPALTNSMRQLFIQIQMISRVYEFCLCDEVEAAMKVRRADNEHRT